MKKYILILILFLLFPFMVRAQYQPPTEYINISIDKLIGYPVSDGKGGINYQYIDNVSINDYVFGPLNYLFFKVRVKNNSNIDLNNVIIKDYLPQYSELYNDPGTYDSSTKTLTINVGSLAADEEKEYLIKGRVLSADKIPNNGKIACTTNRVRVESGSVSDEDTAAYCVQIKVKGAATAVEEVPKAGPELNFIIIFGAILIAGIGYRLRVIKH